MTTVGTPVKTIGVGETIPAVGIPAAAGILGPGTMTEAGTPVPGTLEVGIRETPGAGIREVPIPVLGD